MKKNLLSVITLLVSFTLAMAQVPQEFTSPHAKEGGPSLKSYAPPAAFGYADPEVPPNPKRAIGAKGSYAQVFIELPTLPGAKITAIHFATTTTQPGTIAGVFELSGEPTFSTEEGALVQNFVCLTSVSTQPNTNAYSKVTLKTPIFMEEGKRYAVGYEVLCGSTQSTSWPILVDATDTPLKRKAANYFGIANQSLLKQGNRGKITIYDKMGFGAPYIYAEVEDSQNRLNHIATIASITHEKEITSTSHVELAFTLQNLGKEKLTNAKAYLQIEDANITRTIELTGIDASPGKKSGTIKVLLDPLPTGTHRITCSLSESNGQTNPLATLSKVSTELKTFNAGQKRFSKQILIERFTGERCGNCPAADIRQHEAAKRLKELGYEVNQIVHHTGYGEDFLTLTDSKKLTRYFYPSDGTWAPAFAFNRTHLEGRMRNNAPLIIDAGGVASMVALSKTISARRLPAVITAIRRTEEQGNVANYEVDLLLTDDLNKDNLYISAMITESHIRAQSQAGAPNNKPFYHEHAIREFIYGAFGQKVIITGNKMTVPINSVTYKNGWVKKNCNLVVLVHQDIRATDPTQRAVYSSISIPAMETEKISQVVNAELPTELVPVAYAIEGNIYIRGAVDSYEVYDLAGRRVATTRLPAGTYVVRVLTGDRYYSTKVVVR